VVIRQQHVAKKQHRTSPGLNQTVPLCDETSFIAEWGRAARCRLSNDASLGSSSAACGCAVYLPLEAGWRLGHCLRWPAICGPRACLKNRMHPPATREVGRLSVRERPTPPFRP
jgi:hypothetical protein